MSLNANITIRLQLTPFTPIHQAEARNFILQGLGEHGGFISSGGKKQKNDYLPKIG